MRFAKKPTGFRHKPRSSVPHVLDLLLPRRCLVCGRSGTQLCIACCTALPRLTPPLCARCGAPTAWPVARCLECSGRRLAFASARAAAPYEDGAQRLVAAWKEHGLRGLARTAAGVVTERLPPPEAQAVAFVPSDAGRRLQRGYHPAEQLARELACAWQLPCLTVLRRSGRSRPQRGLPRAERRRNVRGHFDSQPVAGALVLVDDVYTTGATVDAAAAALRHAGAAQIDVVTFARTIRGAGLGLDRG
jgi:predicted amidophosphoribosyltransferase